MPRRIASQQLIGTAERLAWMFVATGVAICLATQVSGFASAPSERNDVDALRLASAQESAPLEQTGSPDLSLWDPTRVTAWRAALAQPGPAPLAVLRIPGIGLEVPVLPGTDAFILNRAVGHITGTALPGGEGNSGIAGHRDGFFRTLKDIAAGDVIELDTSDGRLTYVVERTSIVGPHDVSVLAPTPVRSLTLVTCYPFYFVGPAPQRFIVRAAGAERAIRTP